MTDNNRFIDNGDGTVTDTHTNLMWMKNDSWLDLRAAVPFSSKQKTSAEKYLEKKNKEAFAGHADWRLPTKFEALSLFDPESVIKDHYDMDIHLPPVFPPGGGFDTWTSNVRGKITAFVVSFGTGAGIHKETESSINTSVRLVRAVGPVQNLPEKVPQQKLDRGMGGGWR